MLNLYVKAREAAYRLRDDQRGVVSFEYIIVAACIVGAAAAVFGAGGSGPVHDALNTAMGKITALVNPPAPAGG